MATTEDDYTASTGVFEGSDGIVVIEAESAEPVGDWETTTIDGETVMLWDSDKSNYGTVDEDETLTYTFTVDESGEYYISTHAARDYEVMNDNDRYEDGDPENEERTDTGNDAYIAIYDVEAAEYVQEPTKLYTGLGSADETLKWGDTFDDSSGHYDAVVELEAAKEYQLEITGRSDAYALDRIALSTDDFLYDEDIEESPVVAPSEATESAAVASDGGGGSIFSFIGDLFNGIFGIFSGLFGGGGDDDPADVELALTRSDSELISDVGLPEIAVEEELLYEEDLDEALVM